jgi:hypothetical protein
MVGANTADADLFDRVVEWNHARGLLNRGFDQEREFSFIAEEMLESTGAYDSESGRARAKEIAADIMTNVQGEVSKELIMDSFADIIVYAIGAIAKLGYNPSQVMEEVYLEINSRTGTLVDGKFVKDPEAIKYEADLASCLL